MKHKLLLTLATIFTLYSCGDDSFTPKPTGYFRIDLPKKEYQPLQKDCPFSFEVPSYTTIKKNANNPLETCWFDIQFEQLNANIYISYKTVDTNVNQYLEDSRTLVYKHTVKANDIDQQIIRMPEKKVYGVVYSIEGNAASSYQFHLTDSTNHFIRGSLYFNNAPNQDSIQPVLNFIKTDIEHLINTFEWKN